jgi:hypothetical protein
MSKVVQGCAGMFSKAAPAADVTKLKPGIALPHVTLPTTEVRLLSRISMIFTIGRCRVDGRRNASPCSCERSCLCSCLAVWFQPPAHHR